MTDRLKSFSTDELSAIVFTLDIATTVEPLVSEAEQIRQELIDELKMGSAFFAASCCIFFSGKKISCPARDKLLNRPGKPYGLA